MTMRLILFRTIHGSHLYGTAHANSDNDTFTVYANEPRTRARWAKQHVGEDEDTLKTDLSTFMQYCDKGVPQYLEALWSTMAEIDLIKDLRSDFLPDYYKTMSTYQRTIKSFYARGLEESNPKFTRHAARLYLNLRTFKTHGRFNPTLSHKEKLSLDSVAALIWRENYGNWVDEERARLLDSNTSKG